MALIILSSQAFSLFIVKVPIKVTEEKVQVVQTCGVLPFKALNLYDQEAIRSTQHNAILSRWRVHVMRAPACLERLLRV